MRWTQIKLYSITAPLALFALLDMSFDQIDNYIKGTEFRSILAEVITQLIGGVIDALILAFVTLGFGLTGS